jgi:hypothetical protein
LGLTYLHVTAAVVEFYGINGIGSEFDRDEPATLPKQAS